MNLLKENHKKFPLYLSSVKELGVPVVIDGDNLPSPGCNTNRVN